MYRLSSPFELKDGTSVHCEEIPLLLTSRRLCSFRLPSCGMTGDNR